MSGIRFTGQQRATARKAAGDSAFRQTAGDALVADIAATATMTALDALEQDTPPPTPPMFITGLDFIRAAETMRSSNLRPEEARLRAGLAAIGIEVVS